jgi:hypothetical protein
LRAGLQRNEPQKEQRSYNDGLQEFAAPTFKALALAADGLPELLNDSTQMTRRPLGSNRQ